MADKTIDGYRWALSKLATVDEVPSDPDQPQQIVAKGELTDGSRLDPWRRLRTFYSWVAKHHQVENAMRHLDRSRARRPFQRVLIEHEMADLFDARLDGRDVVMMAVFIDAGMRIGALTSRRCSDVTSDGVRVTGKTGDRVLPLTKQVSGLVPRAGDRHTLEGRETRSTQVGRPLNS